VTLERQPHQARERTMTTPPPIAFEPAAKPAPARRDTGAGDAHSFADTMQAQRANDRATATAATAADGRGQARPADAAQPNPADRSAARASTGHQGGNTGANQGAAANADTAAATPGQTKADGSPATGRGSDQGAINSAGASDGGAKKANAAVQAAQGRAAAAVKAAQMDAARAGTLAAQPRGTTIDGHSVSTVVQDAGSGQARPVNAATALAAHTATAVSGSAGKGASAAKTSQTDVNETSKTGTGTANVSDRADPTAKALKEALSGQADARGARSGEEAADPRGQRTDHRTGGQRTAAAGMNPALRAAAEAVQQQLSGSAGGQTTSQTAGQTAGQAAAQTAGQSANQAAALSSAPGQTFDPVLQNTGPQPGGAGQPGSLAAAGKAAASAGTGAGNPAPTAPPAEQIAVQMQRAAQQGQSRVQIRLNPAELGRIDVKLDVGDDGHVRAALAVDKPETLDLMQRDPRALERALQAAGLKTDPGSLSFNLRDDGTGQGGTAGGDGRDRPDGRPGQLTGDPAGDAAIPAESLRANLPADGRVDIRV
jgi:flagellar hook-length control protein FliK